MAAVCQHRRWLGSTNKWLTEIWSWKKMKSWWRMMKRTGILFLSGCWLHVLLNAAAPNLILINGLIEKKPQFISSFCSGCFWMKISSSLPHTTNPPTPLPTISVRVCRAKLLIGEVRSRQRLSSWSKRPPLTPTSRRRIRFLGSSPRAAPRDSRRSWNRLKVRLFEM